MAGHSKWANIKHKKAKEDAKRGKVFTKVSRRITVAAKEGGGDPAVNFRLRLAIEDAKSVNMPNDNIERAIKRGTGDLEGVAFEEFVYEGYGPGGVAFMLDMMSDNRNRAASEIRHIFSKHGGNLGESGCVAWMFEEKGSISLDQSEQQYDEEELFMAALQAGAEDVVFDGDTAEVVSSPAQFEAVKNGLQDAGLAPVTAEIIMRPTNTVSVNADHAKAVFKLMEALEENDDVQAVHSNVEIDDDFLAAVDMN